MLLDIRQNSIHEIELEKDYDTLQQVVIITYPIIRCITTIYGCGGPVREVPAVSTAASTSTNPSYLQLYPNPSRSNASIYLRLPSETNSRLQAELLNSSGQIIKTNTLQSSKNSSLRFDLPQLSAGIYYVRLTDATLGRNYVGNLIIE